MKKYIALIALSVLFFSCGKKEVPKLEVSFSFTKPSYEIGEPIGIKNTTVIENDEPSMWQWVWEGGSKYGKTFGNGLSFDEVGDYEITLNVKTASGLSGSYSAKAHVVNDNVLPVADFSWSPSSGIKLGDVVTFTDRSSDSDGSITAWEWKFGSDVSTEQNPVFTAMETGEITVTLTVTDDHYGKGTKSATVSVGKAAGSMELIWSRTYDPRPERAYVFWSSPALSPDGSKVHVISSGYILACVNAESGAVEWTSDLGVHGANANLHLEQDSAWSTVTPTPSVDENGDIFAGVGFYPSNEEDETSPVPSGLWSLSAGGATNWYLETPTTRYRCIFPLIVGNYLAIHADKSKTVMGNNFFFVKKSDGSKSGNSHIESGSFYGLGSAIAVRNASAVQDVEYTLVAGQNNEFGSRVYYAKGTGIPGEWAQFQRAHVPDNDKNYSMGWHYISGTSRTGTNEISRSGQLCSAPDGSVYGLYDNITGQSDGKFKSSTYGSILYKYERLDDLVERVDTIIADRGNLHVPNFARNMKSRVECKWVCGIKGGVWTGTTGQNSGQGTGPVSSPDGSVLYVTSCDITSEATGTQEAHVTAVNAATGAIIWEHEALGNICGECAVDSDGYVYYCDYTIGALIKLNPTTGKTIERLTLGHRLRSSPTIAADGSIYCNGNIEDDNDATVDGAAVFKVRSTAKSFAHGVWSQLGGGPRKIGSIHE